MACTGWGCGVGLAGTTLETGGRKPGLQGGRDSQSWTGVWERWSRGGGDTLCVLLTCCPQKADHPDGIPECGADVMRFALCAYTAQGRC